MNQMAPCVLELSMARPQFKPAKTATNPGQVVLY